MITHSCFLGTAFQAAYNRAHSSHAFKEGGAATCWISQVLSKQGQVFFLSKWANAILCQMTIKGLL